MDHTKIKTRGDLKAAGYQPKSIKEELRANLINTLKNKKSVFEGIHGYEETVIPDFERAILAGHNINLLGDPIEVEIILDRIEFPFPSGA